jgi:hypothetical protein
MNGRRRPPLGFALTPIGRHAGRSSSTSSATPPEQHCYIYLYCVGLTGSRQPYVKNFAPNLSFDYGDRSAALWLDKA